MVKTDMTWPAVPKDSSSTHFSGLNLPVFGSLKISSPKNTWDSAQFFEDFNKWFSTEEAVRGLDFNNVQTGRKAKFLKYHDALHLLSDEQSRYLADRLDPKIELWLNCCDSQIDWLGLNVEDVESASGAIDWTANLDAWFQLHKIQLQSSLASLFASTSSFGSYQHPKGLNYFQPMASPFTIVTSPSFGEVSEQMVEIFRNATRNDLSQKQLKQSTLLFETPELSKFISFATLRALTVELDSLTERVAISLWKLVTRFAKTISRWVIKFVCPSYSFENRIGEQLWPLLMAFKNN